MNMSLYPEDGLGMSELKHSGKMTIHIPQNATQPTVCVKNKFFYVGELLCQIYGGYSIPEHYFKCQSSPSDRNIDWSELILYSLSQKAKKKKSIITYQLQLITHLSYIEWFCC